MDVSLDELLRKDDEVFDCFASVADELLIELKSSNYPESIICLMGLMGSINSLKLAAFDLAEESETHLYAIKTLLRPAIEHFLRFSYLHFQLSELKNDSAGEEYRKYSMISETIALVKSKFALETDKKIQEKILEELRNSSSQFDISNRELDRIITKWSYKNIARKLDRSLNDDRQEFSFIKGLVSNYSELSSFVHGGVYAEKYYHSAFSSNTLQKEIKHDVCLFSFLAAMARFQMLLLGCQTPMFNFPLLEYKKKMAQLLSLMEDV